ncbi:TetR/AcrR family transcriptional regulator [Kutzneria viridogrisea]|uniref:AcrR family transcriptional regulator n=1 Tax=Kutzneria viridogrisea TaxID=47990 RepID=A0ABR6BFX9_9PSEU|nr:AcrR family transcriptional regulator [Kutzneria viridogrisea]
MSESRYLERGERILDAAAELVLRWGYRRVTIDEVAKLAGIGKGTVYLHFKTREALFLAVLIRDSLGLFDQMIAAIQADPAELLPHRQARRVYLGVMGRPLLRAMFSRDSDVLGALAHETSIARLTEMKLDLTGELYGLLREHGLVRTDLDIPAQQYALGAIQTGFYLVDPMMAGKHELDLESRADALATVIRNCVEVAGTPDPDLLRALASKIIALFEQLRLVMVAGVHGTPPKGD